MKQLKAEGVSFTRYHLQVAVQKTALVLWGPHVGFWGAFLDGSRHHHVRLLEQDFRTTYTRHVKLDVCCTKEEHSVKVHALGDRYQERMRLSIFCRSYNEALAKVPEWALKEIRRWRTPDRMLVARFLYYTGEQGIPLLDRRDCSYHLNLFKLLDELGRPERIKLMCLEDKRTRLLRKVFPRLTAAGRNVIAKALNLVNEGAARPSFKAIYGKRSLKHYMHTSDLNHMYVYALKPRKAEYIQSMYLTFKARAEPVQQKIQEILWDWTGEFDRRLMVEYFVGFIMGREDNATTMELYTQAHQARTPLQLTRLHDRLIAYQVQQAQLRHADYAAWTAQQNKDLLEQPWPVWDGPALLPGITHLNSLDALTTEGSEMHHCVGGYSRMVFSKECWIFHIQVGDHSATLELNADKQVRQLRGVCNAIPDMEITKLVNTWLKS